MSNPETCHTAQPSPGRPSLGLPVTALIGLALLGLPRVVLHDLGILTEGTLVNGLLVFLPPVVWIGVVLWRRVPNPFLTLLVVGALYGVLLAVGHQVLWNVGFDGSPPRLGGNLADLDPGLQAVIIRSFAAVSSLFTGVMVGVVTGVIAWALRAVARTDRRG